MATLRPPSQTQILVLGGGPGGSYAAAALSRSGFEVTLLEKAKHPRYHIGESQIPSYRAFLRFSDCLEKMDEQNFQLKPGAAARLVPGKREGYTDFYLGGEGNYAHNVERSRFDEVLIRHAGSCGAKVFEEITANSIQFEDLTASPASLKPVSVTWKHSSDASIAGITSFTYLIDATGRNSLMASKYLKHRHRNISLDNVACWGYFQNPKLYKEGTREEGAPYFEALSDSSGWAWFIPLTNNIVSVGIVENQKSSVAKKKTARNNVPEYSQKDHFFDSLGLSPDVKSLLDGATFLENEGVRAAADYSYSAPFYAGPNYRLVGDSAAFIDPFFSSGVHLAFVGALSATCSIASAIRGEVEEEQACAFHTKKVATSYTRWLLVVMSAYQQMWNQDKPILYDVEEDNFDAAFDIFRPIIQGEISKNRDAMERTIDYCQTLWDEGEYELENGGAVSEKNEEVVKKGVGSLGQTNGVKKKPNLIVEDFFKRASSIDDFEEIIEGLKADLKDPKKVRLVRA